MKFCVLWLKLFADLRRFLVLSLRSESALAAENLFLRRQLAFYQERRIKPRRTSDPPRLTLCSSAVGSIGAQRTDCCERPEPSLVGTARASSFSGVGNANLAGRGFRRPPTSDPQDGSREPLMGRGAKYKRVVVETRPPRVTAHDPEVSGRVAVRASWQPSPKPMMRPVKTSITTIIQ